MTIDYHEIDKNHQMTAPKEEEKTQIMFSQKDSEMCPVKSIEKYISKLNPKCSSFFHKPKELTNPEETPIW